MLSSFTLFKILVFYSCDLHFYFYMKYSHVKFSVTLMLQIQKQNDCDFDGIHKISLNNINFNKRGAVLIKDNSLRKQK